MIMKIKEKLKIEKLYRKEEEEEEEIMKMNEGGGGRERYMYVS